MSRRSVRLLRFGVACSLFGIALVIALSAMPALAQTAAADVPAYQARAVSRTDGDVRVSTAALSADESIAVYGAPLGEKRIQPVWIEVENKGARAVWLMAPGVDPDFFQPSEAAEAIADKGGATPLPELERRFRDLAFRNPVLPGETASGFVLTNLHEGAKLVQIDLLGGEQSHTFSLVVPVPGLRSDYERNQVFTREFYPPEQIVDFTDDAAFRTALEQLPCCVSNEKGTKTGDPLNLIIVGGLDDAFPSLVRRGWSPTEVTWSGSLTRMAKSVLAGERYAYSPVSNLYLYGRPQDIALQKARDTIHQRNHLRLWKSPMRYHGKTVWVGQISRDIGSRLTIHSPTLTTHKIDPDVDKAAMALLGDLVYSQNLQKFAFVGGVGASTRSAPRQNLTTDPWYTRGLRAVLFFDRVPTAISDMELLPWETTSEGLLQGVSREARP